MKKKILAIALIFVMAAAFCACGTEKTPASADGSADAAKGSGEEVTLYLSAAASMIESMDKAIAAYEKENPGVKIQATYDSSGTLKTQITSGAADCGIIYATDAYSAEMTPVGYADPEMTGGPCIYPVAVMQNSKHQEEAKKFVDYLFSEEAMAFFTEVGFTEIEA